MAQSIRPNSLGTRPQLRIDIRSKERYTAGHLTHAYHFPAEVFMSVPSDVAPDDVLEVQTERLARYLRQILWPKVVGHFLAFPPPRRTRDLFSSLLSHSGPALVIYHDGGNDFRQLEQMCNLLSYAMQHTEIFSASEREKMSQLPFCTLEGGFQEVERKHLDDHITRPAQRRDGQPFDRKVIHSLLDGVLYYGPSSVFYDHVEERAKRTASELDEGLFEESINERWKCVNNILDLRGPTMIPNTIQYAYSTTTMGKRTISPDASEPASKGWGWSRFMRAAGSLVRYASGTNVSVDPFEDDENVEETTYKLENGFTFKVTSCVVRDDEVIFDTLRRSIEGLLKSRGALLVEPAPYSMAVLLMYLVQIRLWSIRRSLRFLLNTVTAEELVRDGEKLLRPIQHLLGFEREHLPHVYPSVYFHIIAPFFLGMESDLRPLLRLCKNPEYSDIKHDLFAAIKNGRVTEVKRLICTDHPRARSLRHLSLSRRNIKVEPVGVVSEEQAAKMLLSSSDADDATPLIAALQASIPTVRQDESCLRILAANGAVNLTDKYGRDALYYAIREDAETAIILLECGAQIDNCSKTEWTNPLQMALHRGYPLDLIKRLVSKETINHMNIRGFTPSHTVISSRYNEDDVMLIIRFLLVNGANFFLRNQEGDTVLDYAEKVRPGKFCEWLNVLLEKQTSVRYEPYHSYALLHESINMNYYVDGENYYSALADALRKANRTVYIAGWWFTPEIYLKRQGGVLAEEDRLDKILAFLANKGVQIRILLWDNVAQVEDIKNREAAERMERLHQNIRALLHTSALTDGYSHHQKIVCIDDNDAFVGGLDLCLHRWDQQSHPLAPSSSFPGKDYFNPRFLGDGRHRNNNVSLYNEPYEGLKEGDIPRSGWHDIHCRVDGRAAVDVSRNFIQRWNFVNSIKGKQQRRGELDVTKIFAPDAFAPKKGAFQAQVQLTRSISKWALDTSSVECSVMNAISHAITAAKTFVYIETQFFISVQGDPSIVNQRTGNPESLADVIINRIRQAVNKREQFKVILVLPMFPEGDPTNLLTQQIMQEQLKTIEYIQNQINKMTRGTFCDHEDYIRFYSLGNVAYIKKRIVAEQIYIHAKLLITDRHVIIGSANLNMRSLAGDRDTEIAVAAECKSMAEELRKELWREHLGDGATLTDSVLDDVEQWESIAESNSKVYRKLFKGSCPLGAPRNKKEFLLHDAAYRDVWSDLESEEMYHELTRKLQGHLVEFPQHFLEDEVRATVGIGGSLTRGDMSMVAVNLRRKYVQ